MGDDLMGVYTVSMFSFKNGFGYLELITICHFINSLFRALSSVELGFISEEDLEKGEEISIMNCRYRLFMFDISTINN